MHVYNHKPQAVLNQLTVNLPDKQQATPDERETRRWHRDGCFISPEKSLSLGAKTPHPSLSRPLHICNKL